jgi:GT2 family glycosyltransferase
MGGHGHHRGSFPHSSAGIRASGDGYTAEIREDRVTIVVATRDRRRELERSLPHHEANVIVVDNGSVDGTAAAVRNAHPGVDLIELGANRGAAARNVGVARAGTPYVAFADDDSWWAPGALALAADVLDSHPRVAVLAARVLVGESRRLDPTCARMERAPLGISTGQPGPTVLGFMACGAVVRREAFLRCGGFDDVVFFMGEEERVALDLAAAGWALVYVPAVVAHHHPSAVRVVDDRRALAVRNAILVAVMRRPWSLVGRRVIRALAGDAASRAGLLSALPRMPRAWVGRRRLPGSVEAARRALDEMDEMDGSAPRRLRRWSGTGTGRS